MTKISKKAQKWLLTLARQSIEYFLETKNFLAYEKLTIPEDIREEVSKKEAAFILLEIKVNDHKKAYIRGLNGVFDKVEELGKLITQIAVNAAFFDPSSPRLKAYELNELVIHILIPQEKVWLRGTLSDIVAELHGSNKGILFESRGRMAYWLPSKLHEETDVERILRGLRLQLGVKKGAENQIDYYSFDVEEFNELTN